jgi:histidinol-phosphate/aromatic aminotransferase/cobyric acid decarboxylase-like protein
MLDDAQVEDLTYLDPNNPTAYYLEKEEIGLIIMYALL